MRRFVSDFMLPLVRGGSVHVARPLGMDAIARLAAELPATDTPAVAALGACRRAVVARAIPGATTPPLDEASLRLGAALHDLLALSHPDVWHSARRQERIPRRPWRWLRWDRRRRRSPRWSAIRCSPGCLESCASTGRCGSGWGSALTSAGRPPSG